MSITYDDSDRPNRIRDRIAHELGVEFPTSDDLDARCEALSQISQKLAERGNNLAIQSQDLAARSMAIHSNLMARLRN